MHWPNPGGKTSLSWENGIPTHERLNGWGKLQPKIELDNLYNHFAAPSSPRTREINFSFSTCNTLLSDKSLSPREHLRVLEPESEILDFFTVKLSCPLIDPQAFELQLESSKITVGNFQILDELSRSHGEVPNTLPHTRVPFSRVQGSISSNKIQIYWSGQPVDPLAKELEIPGLNPAVTRCMWLTGDCVHPEFYPSPSYSGRGGGRHKKKTKNKNLDLL